MSRKTGFIDQIRLTNVAVVRLKKGGKRVEIACYRNKVVNWRNGVEKDLGEVLQIDTIFENVSKGQEMKKQDLWKMFGTTDQEEICKLILDQGDLQISDKERQVNLENLLKDIATIVAAKCVNPHSNRPYPVTVIEKAMRDVQFSVNPTKSAKLQALEVIPQLKAHMPIERSKMRTRVTLPSSLVDGFLDMVKAAIEGSESSRVEVKTPEGVEDAVVECLSEPGLLRVMNQFLKEKAGNGNYNTEVVDFAVQQEGDADMNSEMSRNVTAASAKESESIFNTPGDVLIDAMKAAKITDASQSSGETAGKKEGLKCATAPGTLFLDRAGLMAHYKTDWHRENLSRREKDLPLLTKEEFAEWKDAGDGMVEQKSKSPQDTAEANDNAGDDVQPSKSKKKKKKKRNQGGGTASTNTQAKTKKKPTKKAEVDDFDADFFGV